MYLTVSRYASAVSSYNPIALGLLVWYSLVYIYKAVDSCSIFIYTCTEASIPCIGEGIYAV